MEAFDKYSDYYDAIYGDKDYTGECNFVEAILKKYSPTPVKTILDGGCGTGAHAIILAGRGYEVTGIDTSATMIEAARRKITGKNLSLSFQIQDLRSLNLNQKFDAGVCMFAVMNYLITTEDILKSLRAIKQHLKPGSLFFFDFWNGLAVLRILPSVRTKTVHTDNKRILRIAEPELDSFNHLCHVNYRMIVTEGEHIVSELTEKHTVRYFFPQEIKHYLEEAGFEVLKMCPFLDLKGKIDENIWNICAICTVK